MSTEILRSVSERGSEPVAGAPHKSAARSVACGETEAFVFDWAWHCKPPSESNMNKQHVRPMTTRATNINVSRTRCQGLSKFEKVGRSATVAIAAALVFLIHGYDIL